MLLFQHIENILKQLMTSARLEGTVHSMQANFDERRARIHKQTLGQLAGQFVDDVLADAGEREAPENVDEAWFSFSFTIQTDSAFVEQHAAEMKAVVDARNDLIHHFLPRWSPASEDSTRAALAYLDEQRAQALPAHSADRGHPFQADRGQYSGRSWTPREGCLSDGVDGRATVRHHAGTLLRDQRGTRRAGLSTLRVSTGVGNPVPQAVLLLSMDLPAALSTAAASLATNGRRGGQGGHAGA